MRQYPLPSVDVAVIDTDVFLKDPYAPLSMQAQRIIVPFHVLEELDELKKMSGIIGRQARQAIHLFEALRLKGDIHQGVSVSDDGAGAPTMIVLPPRFFAEKTLSTDEAVLATAHHFHERGDSTLLCTQDINMRMRASSFGIVSREFQASSTSNAQDLAPLLTAAIPAKDLKAMTQSKILDVLESAPRFANQFVKLTSENNPENYKLFRYLGGKQFKEIHSKPVLGGFTAQNAEQAMALDLLMDDSIQLISLIGKAGTGKTFLVLLAGLAKVLQERTHKRIMVTRPTISLGPDIGFLPGDVNEKLESWMHPVFDNLSMIASGIKQKKLPLAFSTDDLQKNNQLCLQAITYMRGRSLPYQFLFVDEAQNLTPLELKTLITRAGVGTKVIIAGDPDQIDSPQLGYETNGLTVTTRKFMNESIFGAVHLQKSERSELAQKAAELL